MNVDDLAPNTVALVVSLDDDGSIITESYAQFEEDFDIDIERYLCFLIRGLSMMAGAGDNAMATFGSALAIADEYDEKETYFEPADELLDVLNGSDSKVVPINGKKRLN
jgi:hypothetical protein